MREPLRLRVRVAWRVLRYGVGIGLPHAKPKVLSSHQIHTGRLARGWTQQKFAAECGVTPRCVQRWERGEASPQARNLYRVASVIGVSVAELYDGEPV